MPPPPRSRPARNIKANDISFYDDKSHVPGHPYRIEVSRNTNTGKETTSVRTVLDGFEFIREKVVPGKGEEHWRCLFNSSSNIEKVKYSGTNSRCPVRFGTKWDANGKPEICSGRYKNGFVLHTHPQLLPNRYTLPLSADHSQC